MVKAKTSGGELKQEVLANARISDRQLKRWREAALIESPRIDPLGHAIGTDAFYPSGTTEVALEIKRRLRTVRDLGTVAWWMWCDGYPYTQLARADLLRAVDEAGKKVSEGLDAFYNDDPDNPIALASAERLRWDVGWLRGGVGRQPFSTDVYYAAAGLAGELSESDFSHEVPDVLSRSIEIMLEAAAVPPSARGVDSDETASLLLEVFGALNAPTALEWIQAASDEDLESVRYEVVRAFEEWAPDKHRQKPPPEVLGGLVLAFRLIFPDAPMEHPFREVVNALLANEETRVVGERMRDTAVSGKFTPSPGV